MSGLKPFVVDECKHRNNCFNYEKGNCKGCNVWNHLYDEESLIEWCEKHNKDISMFTLKMHKELDRS